MPHRLGSLRGHWWTVKGRFLPPVVSAPPLSPYRFVITDPDVGPVALTGRLAHRAGADSVVIAVHGLGGSEHSTYLPRAAAAAWDHGMSVVLLGRRGSTGDGADVYHAGHTADLHALCDSPLLAAYRHIYVIGYSLGGHTALWFAKESLDARVRAVAAICAPLKLRPTQESMDRKRSFPYRSFLLGALKQQAICAAERGVISAPPAQIERISTFFAFDDQVIAPRFGFRGAHDYYERVSATRILNDMERPAVLVHASYDPIVKGKHVRPHLESTSPAVKSYWCQTGGHVAFESPAILEGHLPLSPAEAKIAVESKPLEHKVIALMRSEVGRTDDA